MAKAVATEVSKGPRTGKVLFKSKHGGKLILRDYTKKDGSECKLIDPVNKKPFVEVIDRSRVFNLNDPRQEIIFNALKEHPLYAPMLIFEVEEEKAEKSLESRALRRKVELTIEGLDAATRPFARLLGLNVNGNKLVVVRAKLLELNDQEGKPEELDRLLNDPNFKKKLLYNSALHYGIFYANNGTTLYNGQTVGQTIDAAMNWFDNNPDRFAEVEHAVAAKAIAEEEALR